MIEDTNCNMNKQILPSNRKDIYNSDNYMPYNLMEANKTYIKQQNSKHDMTISSHCKHQDLSNQIYRDDFDSTGYKSQYTVKKSGNKFESCEKRDFVRPFGINLSNIQDTKRKTPYRNQPLTSNVQNSEFNIRNISIDNRPASSFYNNFISSTNISPFNNISINSTFNAITSNNNNTNTNMSSITSNNNSNSKKQKKRILSTEEIILEKIEKEKQEYEKLKRVNKENMEKLFNNNYSNNYSSNLNIQNNQNSMLSFNMGNCNLNETNDNEMNNIDMDWENNDKNNQLLNKKRKIPMSKITGSLSKNNSNSNSKKTNDLLNNLPSIFNNLKNSEINSSTPSKLLLFEEDYLTLTDDMPNMSIKNSAGSKSYSLVSQSSKNNTRIQPQKTNFNQIIQINKKEEKMKELRRQAAIKGMNLSIFEKNSTNYNNNNPSYGNYYNNYN